MGWQYEARAETALRAPSGQRLLRLGTEIFKIAINHPYEKANSFRLYSGNCLPFLIVIYWNFKDISAKAEQS